RSSGRPYTEIVDSWREVRLDLLRSRKDVFISVAPWTRRILSDGFSFSLFVYTTPERLADFRSPFLAFCAHSHRLAANLLHPISLVLPGGMPRPAGREDVLRHGGLSPLFFAPIVQN